MKIIINYIDFPKIKNINFLTKEVYFFFFNFDNLTQKYTFTHKNVKYSVMKKYINYLSFIVFAKNNNHFKPHNLRT